MRTIRQTTDALDMQLGAKVATARRAALVVMKSVRIVAAERERDAVTAAVAGHTWREIGDGLGVSKQAVCQRFGKDWVIASKSQMSKPEWKQTVKGSLS